MLRQSPEKEFNLILKTQNLKWSANQMYMKSARGILKALLNKRNK
jgi:hypothetical protein